MVVPSALVGVLVGLPYQDVKDHEAGGTACALWTWRNSKDTPRTVKG